MSYSTYLNGSIKKGRLIRWPDSAMPLTFYIAPFRWYKRNQGSDYTYKNFAIQALEMWKNATGGRFSYRIVNSLHESQINLDWKRVERTSLGHCYFNYDSIGRLFSAEVQIGLSDGIIHAKYQDSNEVFHTIIHEIGHAIGLDHSAYKRDIMYVPHEYGVVGLSQRDKNSANWLYRLPCGANVTEIASMLGASGSTDLDYIISKVSNKTTKKSRFEEMQQAVQEQYNAQKLDEDRELLADINKYNLQLQKIKFSKELLEQFKEKRTPRSDT